MECSLYEPIDKILRSQGYFSCNRKLLCSAHFWLFFLPITCIYHVVTLAENCMFESFLGVSHFYRFTSHISRYLTLATIGQFWFFFAIQFVFVKIFHVFSSKKIHISAFVQIVKCPYFFLEKIKVKILPHLFNTKYLLTRKTTL